MKLNLEVNGKPFKKTILFNVLYVLLVTVRVLFVVAILFIPTVLCWLIFPLLGVKNVIYKMIDLYEGLSFLGDKH
ncbi:hypothetical protein [Flavobacterium sp.]|uniref:hypothetical protein n=1 Tax=Flavobacterium sp. TaxID=239 RepID=UPI003F699767